MMLFKSIGQSRERGFSMLEVLISIVVLAIGLLGIAGLQLTSLRATDSANYATLATMLAYDITDKMHANRDHALGGNYDIAMADPAPSSPTTVPDTDLANWLNTLDSYLPEGDGSVAVAGGIATVTVEWNDQRSNASRNEASDTQTFELSVGL